MRDNEHLIAGGIQAKANDLVVRVLTHAVSLHVVGRCSVGRDFSGSLNSRIKNSTKVSVCCNPVLCVG